MINMNSTSNVVLSVRNLKKRIGRKWIINDVSFDVMEGEVFGFLGPNGSGKTTTIRMLVDLIRPTSGSVVLCGYNVQQEHRQALQHVGSIVENPELYPFLTGWENLEHFAVMLPKVTEARIHEVVSIVGMDQRIHDKVKTYSLGMRQRLGIAQALLGNPKLLILDEPTNGLDPQGIKELREFIRELVAHGLSIFISSHLLSEIQLMCDRVAIIRKGEVIAVGTVDELLMQPNTRIEWTLSSFSAAKPVFLEAGVEAWEAQADVGTMPTASEEASPSRYTAVTYIEEQEVPKLSRKLLAAGVDIFAIEIKQPTLEELFLSLTEGERID